MYGLSINSKRLTAHMTFEGGECVSWDRSDDQLAKPSDCLCLAQALALAGGLFFRRIGHSFAGRGPVEVEYT